MSKNNFWETEKRLLPFFVDFLKFSVGFVVIISLALVTLHATASALP